MHKILKEQLKDNFGKEFDFNLLTDKTQLLVEEIESTYKKYDRATKLLQDELQLKEDMDSDYLSFKVPMKKIPHAHSIYENNLLLQQYKNAVHSTSIVSRTDLNGNITYVNSAFCTISGYTKDELIGKNQNITRHPDVDSRIFKDLWHTIESKEIWRGELKNRAKDGSAYYVDMSIFPLLDTKNNVSEYLAIRHDITSYVQTETKLDMEEKFNHMLFNNQDNIVFTADAKRGLISANQKFFDTFNYKNLKDFKLKHHSIGEVFIEKEGFLFPADSFDVGELFIKREGFLFPKDSDNLSFSWCDNVLNHPNDMHKVLIKNKFGEEVIYKLLGSVVHFNNKSFMIISLTDITALEKAREVAEASEKLKSAFMANMSHEIRTPMNGIFGFTKLLKNSSLNNEQQRFIRLIEHSTDTLLKIIDDILDFSKIESGKLVLDLSEVNPFVEIRNAVAVFAPKAKEKEIQYRIHIDSRISECLHMDYLRITQVLTNLINNALKFTLRKGQVTVLVDKLDTSESEQEVLRFSIKDNGIGIAEDRISSIFESFIQADISTTRNFGGTGLGLSISSSLCKLMGSKLKVESTKGIGSCFYFDMIFDKGEVNNTLSKQIIKPPVYLIRSSSPIYTKVALQLKHFNLEFVAISIDELILIKTNNHIVITFDILTCQALVEKKHHVILIQENIFPYSNKVLDKSIYHIESFLDYPSELYNAILELNYVPNKKDNILEDVNLDLNILVVDDYEINRILIHEILSKYKLEADFALNGEEGISKAQEKEYDLILMDINMPILNGIDATKKLRDLEIKTPIVALTANALKGDKERYLSIGMNGYISKPFKPSDLYELLCKYSKDKERKMLANEENMCSFEDLVISLKKAKDVMHFNNDVLKRLFKSFIRNTEAIIMELNEAIHIKNKHMIKLKMHSLRGILRLLYINKIAEVCQKLEYSEESTMEDGKFWELTQKVLDSVEGIHNHKEKFIEVIKGLD